MNLTWYFEGHPKISCRTFCLNCRIWDVWCRALSHLVDWQTQIQTHIFWTLDDEFMGLILTDMVMMAHLWAGGPCFGLCTHTLPIYLMDYVVLGVAWIACRDDVHPPPPWTPSFTPWTLGLFDDDVMLGFDGDVGVFLPHRHQMLIWGGMEILQPCLHFHMTRGLGRPSFIPRRLDITACLVLWYIFGFIIVVEAVLEGLAPLVS